MMLELWAQIAHGKVGHKCLDISYGLWLQDQKAMNKFIMIYNLWPVDGTVLKHYTVI